MVKLNFIFEDSKEMVGSIIFKKIQLESSQLKEVGLELKALNQQFLDIRKRARNSVSATRKRADTRKLSELRKQLGIEK